MRNRIVFVKEAANIILQDLTRIFLDINGKCQMALLLQHFNYGVKAEVGLEALAVCKVFQVDLALLLKKQLT
jgi:hypothetical protein